MNSLQVLGGGAFTGRQLGVGFGPEAEHQRGTRVTPTQTIRLLTLGTVRPLQEVVTRERVHNYISLHNGDGLCSHQRPLRDSLMHRMCRLAAN